MYNVTIRFYEELNDFLPRDMRKRDIEFNFTGRRSIKDLVESMGVPHVEVDLILVNGSPVDFDYIVADGDRISVYPVFESFDIAGTGRLRPEPLREVRFVLDVHLRRLARHLRLLGFDVDFKDDRDDPELAEISSREGRVLLTRDRRLLMRRIVTRGIIIRNTDPDLQVLEVLERLQLSGMCRPFTRCIECNGGMEELEYGSDAYNLAEVNIPPGVRAWCREYYRCRACGKLYWKGTHYDRLRARVEKILGNGRVG